MRIGIFSAVIASLIVIAGPMTASPAAADDPETCAKGTGDQKIAACTREIESGRWKGRDVAAIYGYRADGYDAKGDHDRAAADYKEAMRINPQLDLAYVYQGRGYFAHGDNDLAIGAFDKVLRLEPNSAEALYGRGAAYLAKGTLDRAIADFSEAIKREPEYAGAYFNRGNTYRATGDQDRAIADYNEAIRRNPKSAVAYRNRGIAYNSKADLDRAIGDYNESIRLNPKSIITYFARALAYYAKGDADRALADYNEVLRLNPRLPIGYHARGVFYLYGGDVAKALADLRQASELAPKDASIAVWLDIVRQRKGEPSALARAVPLLDMTAWPAPIVRLFLDQLTPASVLTAAANPDGNKQAVQVCEAHFYSGALALRRGAKDEAKRQFQLARTDCPRHDLEWIAAGFELRALGTTP